MLIIHRPVTTRGTPALKPWAVYSRAGRYRASFARRIHAERFAGLARRIAA